MKENGVLYIHTQIPDPNLAWSHASFDPLTSHLKKSAVSSIPVPIYFLLKVCIMSLLRFRRLMQSLSLLLSLALPQLRKCFSVLQ